MTNLSPIGKRDLRRLRWWASAIERNLRWGQSAMVFGYAKSAWNAITDRKRKWFCR